MSKQREILADLPEYSEHLGKQSFISRVAESAPEDDGGQALHTCGF